MTQKKQPKPKRTPDYSTDSMVVHLIFGLLLIALGILIFLSNALNMTGDVFAGLRQFSRGLCGALAIVLPVLPIWGGLLLMIAVHRKPSLRPFLLCVLMLFLICTAATLITFVGTDAMLDYFHRLIAQMGIADSMPSYLTRAFYFGARYAYGGGLLGMLLAWPLWRALGAIPGAVVTILLAVVDFLFLIKLDIRGLWAKRQRRREDRQARKAAEEAQQHQQELLWQQEQARIQQEQRRMQEAMRQQQIQQLQAQQARQPVYAQQYTVPQEPSVPVVEQVQTRSQRQQPPPTYGFPPTPEELGKGENPAQIAPSPKKRAGLFSRNKADKDDEPAAETPKRPAFSRDPADAPAAPAVPPASNGTARQRTVSQSAEEAPPRRRSVFQKAEPELDEPEHLYYTEDASFYRKPVPKPAAPAPRAEAPAPAPQPRVQPPEEVDEDFAAQSAEKPIRENSFLARLRAAKKEAGLDVPDEAAPAPAAGTLPRPSARKAPEPVSDDDWASTPPWEDAPAPAAAPSGPLRPVVTQTKPEGGYQPELNLKPRRSGEDAPAPAAHADIPYVYPTMNLLDIPPKPTYVETDLDEIRTHRLEQTLRSFHIESKVCHITHGPTISRYELQLAPGIKLERVRGLNSNISMDLEVSAVRIEAPIPGTNLVGVEVPRKNREIVSLREVLQAQSFKKSDSSLMFALGKDTAGTPVFSDLAKMPHILIAGATGSGKSVCVNTILCSLLYLYSPQEVRLILIDPKVVELQFYDQIPHLLIPVVTDPQRASSALAWAVNEMDQRYARFREMGVRGIDSLNAKVPPEERMPRIVVVIDELADLMMTCKKDVETYICRLTQKARAAGIHVIVATQRPSVDVITGVIKSNIPCRIAFKVTSSTDSRTIMDHAGAEQLLKYGDMLYCPAGSDDAMRVQGCYLTDAEIERVTDFIRENCPADYDPAVLEELDRLQAEAYSDGSDMPDMPSPDACISDDGSLLAQCIEMAVQDGQVSTSLIQRRLSLGYARAGRLVDEMEKRGIVSAKDGSKPRKCLISREEYDAMRAAGELD